MKNILTRLPRLLLLLGAVLFAGSAWAQMIVTGTVKDNMGPMESVNVKSSGGKSTITDFDGNYSISVANGNETLTFTSLGKEDKVVKVDGRTKIDVMMVAGGIKEFDDVIVKAKVNTGIGIGIKKKLDITSADNIGGKALTDPAPTLDAVLKGKTNGVQITSASGRPGAGMNVRIRGVGTTGNSDPLYVVDGVPVGSDISHINPGDIESITVLKDATSAAIYGARGANGVIVVTLKQGKSSKTGECEATTVQFDAYWGISSPWKKIDVLNAEEYIKVGKLTGVVNQKQIDDAPSYSTATGTGTNWQDEIFRNATSAKYQLSLTGATARTQYGISSSYTNMEGIVQKTKFERLTVSAKTTHSLIENLFAGVVDKVSVGQSTGFDMSWEDKVDEGNMNTGVLAQALFMDPTVSVHDGNPSGQREGWSDAYYNNINNPARLLDLTNKSTKKLGLGGNAWGQIDFLKHMVFRSQLGYAFWMPTDENFDPKFYMNNVWNRGTDNYQKTLHNGHNYTWTNTVSGEYELMSKADSTLAAHSFNYVAGIEAFEEFQEDVQLKATNLLNNSESMRYLSSAQKTEISIAEWQKPRGYTIFSQFARLNYAFLERYLFQANIRRDGSSKLPDGKKWGVFPSIGGGWRIDQEPFFKKQEWLRSVQQFKVRGGWGRLGNLNSLKEYPGVASLYDTYRNYVINGVIVKGASMGKAASTDLVWETQEQWGIGLDLGFFKDSKLSATIDYFDKKTIDLIVDLPLEVVDGADFEADPQFATTAPSKFRNAGTISNKGVELGLNYNESDNDFFNYNVGGSISLVKNEVLELADGASIDGGIVRTTGSQFSASKTVVGSSIADFNGLVIDGIFTSQAEIATSAQKGAKVGDFRYKDLNGDNQINDKDYTTIGTPHPDFIYSLNCGARLFKSQWLDLSMSIQGSQGGQIFNATRAYLDANTMYNHSTRRLEGWKEGDGAPGEDEIADKAGYLGSSWGSVPHSGYLESASYVRLKDLTIGASVPKKFLDSTLNGKLKSFRVYLQAYNLWTITGYTGFDPEVGRNDKEFSGSVEMGVDRGVYPQARTFVFGVNMKF